MKTNRFVLLVIAAIILFSFNNCSKDTEKPPSVPGENTLFMDFSLKDNIYIPAGSDTSNFNKALSLINFWTDTLNKYDYFVLKSAFKSASSQTPSRIYTKRWSWQYYFNYAASNYFGEMTSEDTTTTSNDSVYWSISFSMIGTKDAYRYIEGKSANDNSGGWWKLYYVSKSRSYSLVDIEWKKTLNVLTYLKFTNKIPNHSNNGSYIAFSRNDNESLNCSYTMNLLNYTKNPALNNVPVQIKWNSSKKNGQIIVNGSVLGCWNSNYINTACN